MTPVEFLSARLDEDEKRAKSMVERRDIYNQPCPKCGRPVVGIGTPWDDELGRALHHSAWSGLGCPLDAADWDQLAPVIGPTPAGKRAVAECAAKRRILRAHDKHCDGSCGDGAPSSAYPIHQAHYWSVVVLASVYADHPDYDQEWAL